MLSEGEAETCALGGVKAEEDFGFSGVVRRPLLDMVSCLFLGANAAILDLNVAMKLPNEQRLGLAVVLARGDFGGDGLLISVGDEEVGINFERGLFAGFAASDETWGT